jgi:Chaperone of endosialidase
MKTSATAGAGIAVCALLAALVPFGATSANPRPIWIRAARSGAAPKACSTNYPPHSFVGYSGEGNVAGSDDSGVLAGADDFVCDTGAAQAGGDVSTIAAGGSDAFMGATTGSSIDGTDGFIGAGQIGTISGAESFVGAGSEPAVAGNDAAVGAGVVDSASGSGSFVGAGGSLNAQTSEAPEDVVSGQDSFAGAGDENTVSGDDSFDGAGKLNAISAAAMDASIASGDGNAVSAEYAAILGGYGNSASSSYGIVAGGIDDTAAGVLAFALGYHADASHNGSFVWSDYISGSATIKDTAANQFITRASGGVTFSSNEAATSGVSLTPGSGTWANLSDRNAKTGIVPLDDATVLAKVTALPLGTWSYTSEPGVRHIGPMAQDFYTAFGAGVDDRHITTVDEDGVALAAIKGLHHALEGTRTQQQRVAANEDTELAALSAETQKLDAIVAKLSQAR